MPRGHTYSRRSSPRPVPLLGRVALEGSAGRLPGCRGSGDWVLCQITSNPYGDPAAIPLDAADFASGGLLVPSVARPGKLFTAHAGLMLRSVGVLTPAAFARVLSAVIAMLQPAASP